MDGHAAHEVLVDGRSTPARASLSVVIPAYNAETTLQQTLDSILSQTRQPDEIIVVDDGSTDGTAKLLRSHYPAVRAISQENGGLAAARNTGCRAANGDYIAFIDADDIAVPRRLAIQAACLDVFPDLWLCFSDFSAFGNAQSPSYMKIYYSDVSCDAEQYTAFFGDPFHVSVTDDGDSTGVVGYRSEMFDRLVIGNFVHPPTIMFRRKLFELVGAFDTTLRYNSDWEWLVRSSRHGAFAFIDAPLVAYRLSNSQLSSQANRAATSVEILQVSERLWTNDPDVFQRHEAQFRAELASRCLDAADALATDEHVAALKALVRCWAYAGPQAAMLPIFLKAILPSSATRLVRAMRSRMVVHGLANRSSD